MAHRTVFIITASLRAWKSAKRICVGCRTNSTQKEAPAGSPQLRELGGGSKGIRLSEWVKCVLGLEQVSGMFTSRDGGRKAHVKGTLNKGTARRLHPMLAHRHHWGAVSPRPCRCPFPPRSVGETCQQPLNLYSILPVFMIILKFQLVAFQIVLSKLIDK